jgi:hypothetical protein
MYDFEKMTNAQDSVYIVANQDATDAEFLPMCALASRFEDLALRWAGRNLTGVGVAGVLDGIPVVMLREEPEDFMTVVRLQAAFARYVVDGRHTPDVEPPSVGDTVAWCETLYALPDTRLDA